MSVPSFVQGLEQRNSQLRHGILEIYRLMQKGRRMQPPVETNEAGQPLIHKLLERLGVLDPEDISDGIAADTLWGPPYQPAVNKTFRPLLESPPITPSVQGASFSGLNQFPVVGLKAEQTVHISQAPAEPPIISDIVPFGQIGQSTSGLMLSIPSPSSSYNALGGDDITSFNNPFGAMQWPAYNPQEEFYEFPGGSELS